MSKRARDRKRGLRWYSNFDGYMDRVARKFARYDRSARSDAHMFKVWKQDLSGWEERTRAPFHKGGKP